MFFAWDILITANKQEADPTTQILKLTKGVITGLDVKFAPGCHSMVKVRILRNESQLVPLSRDEWLTADGETVKTEPYYELTEVPTQLKFVGCSPGTSYPHTITVRVQLLPRGVASMIPVIELLSKLLRRMGVTR